MGGAIESIGIAKHARDIATGKISRQGREATYRAVFAPAAGRRDRV
jgi:hypothetical protein